MSLGVRCTDLQPSWRSVRAARRALKAFSLFYFPLHGLESAAFFDDLDLWVGVESAIYEADALNEEPRLRGRAPAGLSKVGRCLGRLGLWTPGCRKALNDGLGYLRLEKQYQTDGRLELRDIEQAIAARSFDFRILHHLLLSLLGIRASASLFADLSAFERLMESDDDAASRADDASRGTFNGQAAVRAYRTEAIGAVVAAMRRKHGRRLRRLVTCYLTVVPESMLRGKV